jgi:hypothetical protein
LGKISKTNSPVGASKWLLEPVPKYYYCKTLKEAKELAEDLSKEGLQEENK